jgi:hypothetical protein
MRLNKIHLQLALLFVLTISHTLTFAQSDPTGESAVTRTFALTNATVVAAPGNTMEEATVVVKNGLILSVGKNVQIPGNAEIIDATGLYVYPAFIDGMSNTGAKRPEAMERPRDLFTPDPPNDYAGITPENSITEQIDVSSSSIGNMRKVGFGISHAVPYGRMLPGSGSILLLKDAEHMDDIIMSKDVSMYSQFVGAPGAYPGNILGIMAKFRNLYRNAEYHKQHVELYAQNANGIARPSNDRVSYAFHPVIAKQKSVMFDTDEMLDVKRALRLQNDLGFNIMVAGVKQGWEVIDELKAANASVFLSLDLPNKPKDSKDDEKTDEVNGLEKRRMEFYMKYVTQAAKMEEAGVPFGFSARGSSASKVKDNVMTYIENGLSEEAALAALTTNPAKAFGIDQMVGTLEAGKMANIMVSTAPYFTKDSQIKMMFVDGDKYEYEIKEKKAKKESESTETSAPAGDSGAYAAILGTWSYVFEVPGQESTGKMIIKMENGMLTGVLTSTDGDPDQDLSDINYRDGELVFAMSIDAGGQSVEIIVEGRVEGKTYEAEASVAAFNVSFPLTATKDEK